MLKIIGMGNALVDLMTRLPEDAVLDSLGLPKGSMQLVDKETSQKVILQTSGFERSICSGGSAANTIHGLARLGLECGFIGKTGKDEMGHIFRQDLEKSGIKALLCESSNDSGVAVALVSPDSERTFATYLGAAVELSAGDLNPTLFEGYNLLHIEGYLMQNYELIYTAVKLAKELGLKVSIDLASYNVVDANRDFLWEIIRDYCDIVFANEEEAKALTGKAPHEALEHIAAHCDLAIVKIGKDGSLVKNGTYTIQAGAEKTEVLDTTGAGDLYASGFLYGLSREWDLDRCAQAGAIVASEVIAVIGAKVPEARWSIISEKLIKIACH